MTTKWIEENWWFPWDSAEEAKVEAFREILAGKAIEFYSSICKKWELESGESWHFNVHEKFRPCHPHRALIDQYEPGQECEVFISIENKWIPIQGVPQFYPEYQYRLKQSAPIVDWSSMPAWAEWVAMDSNGDWFWYSAEPIWLEYCFKEDNMSMTDAIPSPFQPKFTGDWTQSKVRRPR